MNRSPLLTLPADESPVINLFRAVTEFTTRTPGEVIRDVLYQVNSTAQGVAYISDTAGAAPGSKTGKVHLRLNVGNDSPVTMLMQWMNTAATPGTYTNVAGVSKTEAERAAALATYGVQIFKREGPDGKTLTFKAFGRVETEPEGGVDVFAAVVDSRTAARRNVGTMIDAILDAGDALTVVVVDGDATRNPLGLVLAIDADDYDAADLAAALAFPEGSLPNLGSDYLSSEGAADEVESVVYTFGALPVSSTNAANYQ